MTTKTKLPRSNLPHPLPFHQRRWPPPPSPTSVIFNLCKEEGGGRGGCPPRCELDTSGRTISNWIISPGRVENKTCLKPPTSLASRYPPIWDVFVQLHGSVRDLLIFRALLILETHLLVSIHIMNLGTSAVRKKYVGSPEKPTWIPKIMEKLRKVSKVLLMEEILHHLGCVKPCK